MSSRIAVIGHHTYFANHFPERWSSDRNVLCLDVDESDYSFLIAAANFNPDITLFYRPELYPERYLRMIGGLRIGFLSEPVPEIRDGRRIESSENQLRLAVYQGISWASFHRIYYYDKSKSNAIESLGWPVTGFRSLPIDTSFFKPGRIDRPIDICFIGKATPHRIWQLDFLRAMSIRFVWIAHGISGEKLAAVLRRSKVVLNIHADGLPALEPRIWLAAACGCVVLTEKLPLIDEPIHKHVIEYDGPLNGQHVRTAIKRYDDLSTNKGTVDLKSLGCRLFLQEQLAPSFDN